MSMAYTIKRYICFLSLVLFFVVILSTEARADLYGFEAISNNSGVSGTLAAQLSVKVEPYGTDQVVFTFHNAGPLDSSITDVYFDDGALFELAKIFDAESTSPDPVYSGVDFEKDAKPPDLPEGNTLQPPFEVTAGFLADSESPIASNGVNPGEYLGIVFDLIPGQTFADVIAAINVGFNPDLYYDYDSETWSADNLRVGLRIQSYGEGNEFSDGFILTPTPGALFLGSIGIGMVIARCRRRKTLIES